VRNTAVAHATGDFIAFIDDDEFPADDWLIQLRATCDRYKAAGVLGPVRPHFDEPPPAWIIKGGFLRTPGTSHWHCDEMGWLPQRQCPSFGAISFAGLDEPFRPEFVPAAKTRISHAHDRARLHLCLVQ
jgi:glycosyltransferase involved in cell wall biosynthesis